MTSAAAQLASHLPPFLMSSVTSFLRRGRGRRDAGSSIVEYLLLIVLVAVVCIGALTFFGASNRSSFSEISSTLGTLP